MQVRDALGWRKKIAVIGPSTNTIVEPDFDGMRPVGVTNHYSRIYVEDPEVLSDESFMAGTKAISDNVSEAVRYAKTCKPDYMAMGMSAITFYGGLKGAQQFEKDITAQAGVGVSCGSIATAAALKTLGVKSVSFVSPYYPVANKEVRQFLEDCGFKVVKDVPLRCRTFTAIAHVQEHELRDVLLDLNKDEPDCLLQVGTNLSMVRLAAAAERFFAKPVVAINTATYWHALRACGIEDKVGGYGQLLEKY
jgi:maleate isomerase